MQILHAKVVGSLKPILPVYSRLKGLSVFLLRAEAKWDTADSMHAGREVKRESKSTMEQSNLGRICTMPEPEQAENQRQECHRRPMARRMLFRGQRSQDSRKRENMNGW